MKDLHQTLTDRIIEALEAGVKPWECPWVRQHRGHALPVNFKTGERYHGLNVLLLWMTAQAQGYRSNAWITFQQAKSLGYHVRQGEKATLGVFYKPLERTLEPGDPGYPPSGNGEPVTVTYPMAKAFYVFNRDQIDGIPVEPVELPMESFTANAKAERLLARSGAVIHEQGERACYRITTDEIFLPERRRFTDEDNFYATATHELTHWTGHPSRLNRHFTGRFGDQSYAFEELVAELGSAFVNAELGLTGLLESHASYIDSWLTVLKQDKRAVFKAASLASQAQNYLMDYLD